MFKFPCYFPVEKPLVIPITLDQDSSVALLLEAIVANLQRRPKSGKADIQVDDILLFKTDISMLPNDTLHSRALQWIHEQSKDRALNGLDPLSLVFPEGAHPVNNMQLDILVVDAEVLEMVDGLDDPFDGYNRKVKKALDEHLNNLSPGPSPFDIVNSTKKMNGIFGDDKCQIHLNQVPATIFNPALAALQQRLENLDQIEVSRQEVVCAADYLYSAVNYYDDESARELAIKRIIDETMGGIADWGETVELDKGIINPRRCDWYHDFLITIIELKNTLGIYGDAHLQSILGYSKMVTRNKLKPFRQYCNFPVVIVGLTANRIEISAAVCVGSVYVSRLLTLDCSLGFHTSKNMICLARVFSALSRCRIDLRNYYDDILNLAFPKLSCLFPNPTPVDPRNTLPKLIYRQFFSRAGQPTPALVDLKNITTTMYIATLNDTEVIVKFAVSYNEAAHHLLAEAHLAPKLHFCGRVVGDLFMVVMERVDGKSVWQLQHDKTPIPGIIPIKVEEAVGLLHNEGIVFGDLRSNNILYAPSDCVVIVDFDWAGKDGESRYPGTLNLGEYGKTWAEDVLPYGIMHKEHDLWQLDQLKKLCA